jgi:hypothetical protein
MTCHKWTSLIVCGSLAVCVLGLTGCATQEKAEPQALTGQVDQPEREKDSTSPAAPSSKWARTALFYDD